MSVVERLTGAPARLLHIKGIPANYRILREMAIDGRFPAYQINTIWHYNVADLDLIADAWMQRNHAVSQAA